MKKYKYDVELLAQLPIEEVLEALGAKKKSRGLWSCFNTAFHSNNDKKPSLGVNQEKNICHCFSCGVAGNPVDIAKVAFDGDFKKGCEWLHSYFNIPFLDNQSTSNPIIKPQHQSQKKVKYLSLKELIDKPFKEVKLKEVLQNIDYKTLSPKWKLMLIYTFIYRMSLYNVADDWRLRKFYESRGIKTFTIYQKIGVLTPKKIREVIFKLTKYFPMEDLVEFKILKVDGTFRYFNKYGFAVIPSFYPNSDLVSGLVLRGLFSAPNTPKEFVVSCSDVVKTLPYGVTVEELKNKATFFITEGHIDALSIPFEVREKAGIIATPGVYSLSEEQLGLLRNKKVIIAFDMDKAGREAAEKLAQKLKKAGAMPHILSWDSNWGKDLNELLLNNKIQEVLAAIQSLVA